VGATPTGAIDISKCNGYLNPLMPNTDPQKYREYMRDYMASRYATRRQQAFDFLGGKCAKCPTATNLEVDHKDRASRVPSSRWMWNLSKTRFLEELHKCQLLCRACHATKSTVERGLSPARGRHGTLSTYRHCRCELCVAAKRDYNARYKDKHKAP
jgi:hypothetical protein